VSPYFVYRGEQKVEEVVAHSPFGDNDVARAFYETVPAGEFIVVDSEHELDVSNVLKQASVYVRTRRDDALGWRALSAMAAGCVVLTTPPSRGLQRA